MTLEEVLRINKHFALQILTEAWPVLIDACPFADRQLYYRARPGKRDKVILGRYGRGKAEQDTVLFRRLDKRRIAKRTGPIS